MNLRSAIEGEPQSDRLRTLMSKYFCKDQEHQDMLKEKGRIVLIRSGASRLLRQLADLISEQGFKSEVDLEGMLMNDGTVEEMLRWDRWDDVRNGRNLYTGIIIRARSLTGDVFVQGNETELVSRNTWKTDKEAMVRAIADAYRNPALIGWPSVSIG